MPLFKTLNMWVDSAVKQKQRKQKVLCSEVWGLVVIVCYVTAHSVYKHANGQVIA